MRPLADHFLQIDLRSLGAFRILLALLLLADVSLRRPHLEAFYTSFGLLPIEASPSRAAGEFHVSLLDGFASLAAVRAFFWIGSIALVALLVGWKTRASAIVAWLFYASVLNRNLLTRHGGDVFLVTMLFWAAFLPLGARFSIDALRPGARTASAETERTLAALAIVVQIALVYALAAFAKSGAPWLDGSAIAVALEFDQMRTGFGGWVASWPMPLLRAITWGVLLLEWLAAPAILSPWGQPALRRCAIALLASMHLGTAATLVLGTFPFAMIASHVLLLRAEDWALLGRARRRLFERGGTALRRAIAAAKGAAAAFAEWTTAVRDPSASAPSIRSAARIARETAVALVFACVLLDSVHFNLRDRLGLGPLARPRLVAAILESTQLVHDWQLFAPHPSIDDGWWVVDAVTVSGRRLDPLTGAPPTFAKPEDLARRHDVWWRKVLYRLWLVDFADHRLELARWITRRHRRSHPYDPLDNFRFYYVEERTRLGERPEALPPRRVLLWSHDCFLGRSDAPAVRPPIVPDQSGEDSQTKRSGSPS